MPQRPPRQRLSSNALAVIRLDELAHSCGWTGMDGSSLSVMLRSSGPPFPADDAPYRNTTAVYKFQGHRLSTGEAPSNRGNLPRQQ
jgi:hypothetical protein